MTSLGAVLALSALLPLQDGGKKETSVELSQPLKGGDGLGTSTYGATAKEAPFLKKITEKRIVFWSDLKIPKPENMTEEEWAKQLQEEQKQKEKEKANVIPEDKYQLADQAGQYVGWFGIVRESAADEKSGMTTLTVEHKYFDGLVDSHQQIVSIFGAGDFTATLRKAKASIPALALVRVYGKVVKDKNGAPSIVAEYVRAWDWGLFAFMNYGKDKSNPKWVALRKVDGEHAYSSRPGSAYYEELLGKRE